MLLQTALNSAIIVIESLSEFKSGTNSIFAGDCAPHAHTSTCCAVDTSSGYADGPGGDNGSFSNFATKDHASRAVDDPGGDIDDPGGGTSNDWGSFSNLTTSASTSSKAQISPLL